MRMNGSDIAKNYEESVSRSGMTEPLTIASPYAGIDWRSTSRAKAQFHTHTNRPKDEDGHSGSEDAHDIVDFYAGNDFGVLTLGDHESRGPPPLTWPWTALTDIEPSWENRYPVGQHDEAGPSDTTVELIAIKGLELGRSGDPEDMVSLFSNLATSPSDDNLPTLQAVEERGGIAWLAHPSRYGTADEWGDRWWREALRSVEACLGFEIYNPGYDVDESVGIWDVALADLHPERQIWAFAGDDLHVIRDSYPRAWQTVLLEERTQSGVRTALEAGRTFASIVTDSDADGEPPRIDAVIVANDTVRLETEADRIEWISNGTVVGTGPELAVEGSHVPYVRATVTNAAGRTSIQPITVTATG